MRAIVNTKLITELGIIWKAAVVWDKDRIVAAGREDEVEIPEGCEWTVIPGGLWAEFKCRGPLPDSLQSVNTQIWSEWLPALKGYTLAGDYDIEVYLPPEEGSPDMKVYIWVPLKKA